MARLVARLRSTGPMRNDAEVENPSLREPKSVPDGGFFDDKSLLFLEQGASQEFVALSGTCTQDDIFNRVKAFLPRIKRANQDVVKESHKKRKESLTSPAGDSIVAIERLDDDVAPSVCVKDGEPIELPTLQERAAGSLAAGDASPLLTLRSTRGEAENAMKEEKGKEEHSAALSESSPSQVEMEICLGVFDMPSAEQMTVQEATERGMTLVEKDSLPLWNVPAHKSVLIQELSLESGSDSDGQGEEDDDSD